MWKKIYSAKTKKGSLLNILGKLINNLCNLRNLWPKKHPHPNSKRLHPVEVKRK